MKVEHDDSIYTSNEGYNSSDLQKAVNTIMYGDDDYEPSPTPKKKKKTNTTPVKKFVETDADSIVFHKIAVPKTMKSIYWKYFGFPAGYDGEVITKRKICCTLCSTQLAYLGNTTNLKSHLSHKHVSQFANLQQNAHLYERGPMKKKDIDPDDMFHLIDITSISQQESSFYNISVQGENEGEQAIISIPQDHAAVKVKKRPSTVTRHYQSGKSLVDLIVDYVILDLQPPSIVNSEGLRHLLSNLSPVCEIPTEQSIIQDIVPKMYDQLKNAMYNDITAINMSDSTMTLSMEHWLQDDREYISYYINYILNEDQFTTKLLHTFLLDKENIDNTFYHQEMFNIICSSWNIKISNIKAVILASNNDALHQVVVNQEIAVIPCLNHTLSDMCLQAFQIPEIQAVIVKCRNVISQIYNKNNFAIHLSFPDQNGQMDSSNSTFLSLDNPNVWLSTLNMLEALNAARSKLNVLLEIGDGTLDSSELSGHMSEDEWFLLARVVEIFNPIRVTVVTMSEEKPAHASLILPLYLQLVNHHLKVELSDDSITIQLKNYFVKSLTSKYASVDAFLQICTALDPRVKKLPYIEEHDVFHTTIRTALLSMEPPASQYDSYNEDTTEQDSKKNIRLSGMEFLLGHVAQKPSAPVKSLPPSHAESVRFEVDRYVHTSPAPLNECPTVWWKSMSSRFPMMYQLAQKYSCIPATCGTGCKEMKAECNYFEKRKMLSLNTQAVLNHLLFLHHNYHV